MNWEARIDEVAAYLTREFRVEDRAALEILLAALAPCPRTRSLWLVLETNWFARDCAPAWFSFGESWVPRSLAQIRARTPWRGIETIINELLDEPDQDRLFVEPDFERLGNYSRCSNSLFILDRALRVRTVEHRTFTALLSLDKREEERRAAQLSALVNGVMRDRVGARSPDPPQFVEPPHFAYYTELVQRLSPWFRDWAILVQAFGLLAVRHAWLFGRTATDATDVAVLARAAADCVPPWVGKAVRHLLDHGPSKAHVMEKVMGLEQKAVRTRQGAHFELTRLRRKGLVRWSPRKLDWSLVEEHRRGMEEVISGRAFGHLLVTEPSAKLSLIFVQ
jgi:hypothetical protein